MSASSLVAEAVWRDIRSTGSVTDDQLSILNFLYGKNFERATRIVDQRGVKRISGEPSGRCVFQVVGESKRREEYFCFAEHYCACYSFFYDIVSRGEQLCCKHQLAARLAVSVGACVEVKMKYVKPMSLFHDLLKKNAPEKGRLLGLDVGNKYIGLAVSDIHNKIASPLSVLVRKQSNIELMAKDFQTLISELSLRGFVIGCTFHRQRCSPDAAQVKRFVEVLRKTGNLEGLRYTYWDERFTSKCVESPYLSLDLHPVLAKTIVDKFAAVGILQEYLDYMHRNLESDKSPH